jgi:hypothetical protein
LLKEVNNDDIDKCRVKLKKNKLPSALEDMKEKLLFAMRFLAVVVS